eukprot:scaffold23627_cov60-Phaeocystis_antarctica.AAC.11
MVLLLEYGPHLSPHEAGAQGDRQVNLLSSGKAHTVVAKPALPAAPVNLLAAVHGHGRQGGDALSLPLAQSEGRGLGADGTKDGNDANDDEGAEARGAAPRLVVNKIGNCCRRGLCEARASLPNAQGAAAPRYNTMMLPLGAATE